jgi:hypothetical protein
VKSSIAIAALVATAVGLGVAATAFAQDATDASSAPQPPAVTAAPPAPGAMPGAGMMPARAMMPHRTMGPGALLMLACSPQGSEALDGALLHLSYRLDLTSDQKPLFQTFHDKAMADESTFSDACKSNAPATADSGTKPDFMTRFKDRLAVDQARLTALNDVLPSFEALYATLTDTQKAALLPHHMGMGPWKHNGGDVRWGQQDGNGSPA